MKKTFYCAFILALCLALGMTLTACDFFNNEQEHSCTFQTTWSHDETHHWFLCEDYLTCSEVSQKAEHSFVNGVCECGYEHAEHSFVDGICYCGKIDDSADLVYQLNPDGLSYTIVGKSNTKWSDRIVIPSYYNNLPVTSISDNAFVNYANCLTGEVLFEENCQITSIGKKAFAYCNLTNIIIPASVETIGDEAFYYCNNLTDFSFENESQIKFVGHNALTFHSGDLTYNEYGGGAYLGSEDNNHLILYETASYDFENISPNAVIIYDEAFKENKYINEIEIPSGVTCIGNEAFNGCSNLTSVTFGSNSELIEIRSSAFSMCTSLANISMPEGLTTIGSGAFLGCCAISEINIPSNVISIGQSAFRDCAKLTHIFIPKGVTKLSSTLFYGCSELVSINFDTDSELTSIDSGVFYGCSALESINIPEGVETIEDLAFYNCISLKSVVFPSTLTAIRYEAFYNCSKLKDLMLPTNISQIDRSVFAKCSSIETIVIPSAVIKIAEGAFSDCTSLSNLSFDENSQLTSIGKKAFSGCTNLKSVEIPKLVSNIEVGAFFGSSSGNVYYQGTLTDWCNITFGSAYSNPMSDADNFYLLNNGSYTIIEAIHIPDTTTYIRDYAFYGFDCLKEITISKSVRRIGEEAFDSCINLSKLAFENQSQLTNIGKNSFNNCRSLTSIVLPDGVETIEYGAFSGCFSLTEITIPKSVQTIGDWAFHTCDKLEKVYYTGSETQWKTISIKSYNDPLTGANIQYNSFN